MSLVDVADVRVWFTTSGFGMAKRLPVRAVDGVSITIGENEVVGLVGESGSGKTTLGRTVLKLIQPTDGKMLYDGQDMINLKGRDLRKFRRSVQAVFQDPYSSFNPRMRVRDIVSEPLLVQGTKQEKAYARAAEVLEAVGIDTDAMERFPHQFSGGQRQRIAIARALSASPRLIVLDEPVASLDVSIRGQVINLLSDIRRQFDLSLLLISHDLSTTRYLSDRIYVMYSGRIVEHGPAQRIYDEPIHPYTKALLTAAKPVTDGSTEVSVQGEPPNPRTPPSGCRFHPRCPWAMDVCVSTEPEKIGEASSWATCHLYDDSLAKDERTPLPGRRVPNPHELADVQKSPVGEAG